jgi:hypothetical protein
VEDVCGGSAGDGSCCYSFATYTATWTRYANYDRQGMTDSHIRHCSFVVA